MTEPFKTCPCLISDSGNVYFVHVPGCPNASKCTHAPAPTEQPPEPASEICTDWEAIAKRFEAAALDNETAAKKAKRASLSQIRLLP